MWYVSQGVYIYIYLVGSPGGKYLGGYLSFGQVS